MKEIDNNLESEVVDRFWILTVTGFGAHVLYRMEVNTTTRTRRDPKQPNNSNSAIKFFMLINL